MFSWGELFSTFLARKIMGVEGSCRAPNGGGCPFCMLPGCPGCPGCSLLPSWQIFRQSGQIFGKKWQKLTFICLAWCFLGKIGDNKGQKSNIFWKVDTMRVLGGALLVCLLACPLVAGGRLSGVVLCFRAVFPPFCPLCCFALVVLLANMPLFAF